jgi:MFS family permease
MILFTPQSPVVGRRPLLVVGAGIALLGCWVFLGAHGPTDLAIGRVISGLSTGAVVSTATGTMLEGPSRRHPRVVSAIAVSTNYACFGAAILVGGALAAASPAPLRWPYVAAAIASGVAVILAGLVQETEEVLAGPRRFQRFQVKVPREIRPAFWVSVLAIIVTYALSGFFGSLAGSFYQKLAGVESPAWTGAGLALMFALVAVAAIALHRRSDREALRIGFPIVLVSLGLFVSAVQLRDVAVFVAGTGLLGFGLGAIFWGSLALLNRISPEKETNHVLAGYYTAGYLALSLPTVGLGVAFASIGIPLSATAFALILGVLVAAAWLATVRTPLPGGGG